MDIKEFAKKLNGREYGEEVTKEEEKEAKELGFVVVFGYSDDNTEFRGAIDEEVGSWDGAEILLDKEGIVEDCDCKYGRMAKENAKMIEAIWCGDPVESSWSYKTEIPHATFDIYEDEIVFCRGIIFDIKSL